MSAQDYSTSIPPANNKVIQHFHKGQLIVLTFWSWTVSKKSELHTDRQTSAGRLHPHHLLHRSDTWRNNHCHCWHAAAVTGTMTLLIADWRSSHSAAAVVYVCRWCFDRAGQTLSRYVQDATESHWLVDLRAFCTETWVQSNPLWCWQCVLCCTLQCIDQGLLSFPTGQQFDSSAIAAIVLSWCI